MDISSNITNHTQETCIDRDSSTPYEKNIKTTKRQMSLLISPLTNQNNSTTSIKKSSVVTTNHEVRFKQREKYLNDIKSIDLSKYTFANE